MATKDTKASAKPTSKPAAKAAPKSEKKPVVVESITVDARQDGATFVINDVEYLVDVQAFLGLRHAIEAQATGLVH